VIALDTSAIVAIALDEPEAEAFKRAVRDEAVLIGWPTLFETRIVLASKGFANASAIVAALADAPNVAPCPSTVSITKRRSWRSNVSARAAIRTGSGST
jgi:ribonuclease VapC